MTHRRNQPDRRRNPPGTIYHRLASAAGRFMAWGAGLAYCGASRTNGALFTPFFRLVNCEKCKAKILAKRAEAKARFHREIGAAT